MLRLIVYALLAALAGTVTGVLVLYGSYLLSPEMGAISVEDALGFGTLIPMAGLLLCALLYTPGLMLLRRRRKSCEPASLFMLTSALLLNVPVFIGMLVAQRLGNTFFGLSEVSVFILAFVVTGLVFGRGFTAYCRRA